jgi:cell division transport system permease protein
MRALIYAFGEAGASLWRGRGSALVAVFTIAAGLFVLGFFLLVNANLQRLVGRWAEAAELSIYFHDTAGEAERKAVEDAVQKSGLAREVAYVSKDAALARFRQDFPDLAGLAGRLDRNPFPASVEVGLNDRARGADGAIDTFLAGVTAMPGVSDVRHDRLWLARLNRLITIVGGVGLAIVVLLAVAAALTVANVVRLAAYARRDEIEIMHLVGAPASFVRGPFIAEGVLQGGIGALIALAVLAVIYRAALRAYGSAAAETLGLGRLSFIPAELCVLLVAGGMLLGCVGGLVAVRRVR